MTQPVDPPRVETDDADSERRALARVYSQILAWVAEDAAADERAAQNAEGAAGDANERCNENE